MGLSDNGELWENTIFRFLADKYNKDKIRYSRTGGGNEIDFVLPNAGEPKAIEVKYDKNQIRISKYKLRKVKFQKEINFV